MIQQGQVFRLKSSRCDGAALWAYRNHVARRSSGACCGAGSRRRTTPVRRSKMELEGQAGLSASPDN